jgi:RimJ/RimL family protein N-acetyltransferase
MIFKRNGIEIGIKDRDISSLEIKFKIKEGEPIILRPVRKEDLEDYKEIFCDPESMGFYRGGAWTQEYCEERLEIWEKRWQEKNPYSAMKIVDSSDEIIGHVVFGVASPKDVPHNEDYKQYGEVAAVIAKDHRNKGIMNNVAEALELFYFSYLTGENAVSFGIEVPIKSGIVATTSLENEPIYTLLANRLGVVPIIREEKSLKDDRLLFQATAWHLQLKKSSLDEVKLLVDEWHNLKNGLRYIGCFDKKKQKSLIQIFNILGAFNGGDYQQRLLSEEEIEEKFKSKMNLDPKSSMQDIINKFNNFGQEFLEKIKNSESESQKISNLISNIDEIDQIFKDLEVDAITGKRKASEVYRDPGLLRPLEKALNYLNQLTGPLNAPRPTDASLLNPPPLQRSYS